MPRDFVGALRTQYNRATGFKRGRSKVPRVVSDTCWVDEIDRLYPLPKRVVSGVPMVNAAQIVARNEVSVVEEKSGQLVFIL